MIQWRTDVESAPKDGTKFFVPSPWQDSIGCGVYTNCWFPPLGDRPGRFSVETFTHWCEINLPAH